MSGMDVVIIELAAIAGLLAIGMLDVEEITDAIQLRWWRLKSAMGKTKEVEAMFNR